MTADNLTQVHTCSRFRTGCSNLIWVTRRGFEFGIPITPRPIGPTQPALLIRLTMLIPMLNHRISLLGHQLVPNRISRCNLPIIPRLAGVTVIVVNGTGTLATAELRPNRIRPTPILSPVVTQLLKQSPMPPTKLAVTRNQLIFKNQFR